MYNFQTWSLTTPVGSAAGSEGATRKFAKRLRKGSTKVAIIFVNNYLVLASC